MKMWEKNYDIVMCNECGQRMMTTAQLIMHKRMKHGFAKAEQEQKKMIEKLGLGIDWV